MLCRMNHSAGHGYATKLFFIGPASGSRSSYAGMSRIKFVGFANQRFSHLFLHLSAFAHPGASQSIATFRSHNACLLLSQRGKNFSTSAMASAGATGAAAGACSARRHTIQPLKSADCFYPRPVGCRVSHPVIRVTHMHSPARTDYVHRCATHAVHSGTHSPTRTPIRLWNCVSCATLYAL